MKHTPGPWKIITEEHVAGTEYFIRSTAHDQSICIIKSYEYIVEHMGQDGKELGENAEANAKLIAAAPENTECNIFWANKIDEILKVFRRYQNPNTEPQQHEALQQLIELLDNSELKKKIIESQAAIKKATS